MNAIAEPLAPAADEMPVPLIFTDSAAAKVADLVAEEGNPELKLRVFVQGGGCSGFQYGFTFDEVVNEDDTQMAKNGVTLLIDAMSLQYLAGAEIDHLLWLRVFVLGLIFSRDTRPRAPGAHVPP